MTANTVLSINSDDFLTFFDRALDGMAGIIEELGDELANQKPAFEGANSPYAILTHCIGVVNHWVGNSIAGRGIPRDRDAEFIATGTLAEIREQVDAMKARLREDVRKVDGPAPLPPAPAFRPGGRQPDWTQGASLIHAYEELAQHHGQMEITRDILRAREL